MIERFDKLSVSPAKAATELDGVRATLAYMTEVASPTLTVRQMLFFVAAATFDLRGRPATLTGIRQTFGSLGRSIEKSKDILLEPSRHYPEALGWLTQELDPNDKRVRYLRLTDTGYAIINGLIETPSS